jgi:hypothetical protein
VRDVTLFEANENWEISQWYTFVSYFDSIKDISEA